jgi:hypothetical protein
LSARLTFFNGSSLGASGASVLDAKEPPAGSSGDGNEVERGDLGASTDLTFEKKSPSRAGLCIGDCTLEFGFDMILTVTTLEPSSVVECSTWISAALVKSPSDRFSGMTGSILLSVGSKESL